MHDDSSHQTDEYVIARAQQARRLAGIDEPGSPKKGHSQPLLEIPDAEIEGQEPDEIIKRIAIAQRSATPFRGWTVLTNTIFGVGILALAFAASECGLILGGILLLGAAIGAKFSLHLLSCIAIQFAYRQVPNAAAQPRSVAFRNRLASVSVPELALQPVTFYAVCEKSLPWIKYFIDGAIAVKCFGVSISFLIVAGSMIPDATPSLQTCSSFMLQSKCLIATSSCKWHHDLCTELHSGDDAGKILGTHIRAATILISVGLILPPICYRKRLETAWITNSISLLFFVYIVFLTLAETISVISSDGFKPHVQLWPRHGVGVLKAIPVFIFAYTCHQNLFPVANELVNPSVRRLDMVTSSAIGAAFTLYAPVLALGYVAYGGDVRNPILLNFPNTWPSTIAHFCMAVSAVFCYPNQLHPCRRSIQVLFEAARGSPLSYQGEKWYRRITTTLLLVGSCGVAIAVDDLSVVFQLIGGIASNTICYLAPTLLYMRLFWSQPGIKWYCACFQFMLGCIILPCSLIGVFLPNPEA